MARAPGTNSRGGPFDEATIEKIWQKGTPHKDNSNIRYDKCGTVMWRSDYGNTNDKWGWEIDHILPIAKGGTDDLSNLQPLQWENNRRKGDTYPWSC